VEIKRENVMFYNNDIRERKMGKKKKKKKGYGK
jgi:hypothetical protein